MPPGRSTTTARSPGPATLCARSAGASRADPADPRSALECAEGLGHGAVAKRRGLHRAIVAVARKLAIILHRMWIDLGGKHEPRGDVEVQAKNGGWLTGKPL